MSGLPLKTLVDTWRNTCEKWPRKPAVIHQGRAYTYGEIDLLSGRLARRLSEDYGIGKGGAVAVAMPNCIEFYIAYWAALKLGAAIAPVNIRLRTEEMQYVIGNTGSPVLLTHGDVWDMVEAPAKASNANPVVIGAALEGEGIVPFDCLIADGDPLPTCATVTEDDLAVIMHTSGTTGQPKGAIMTHGDMIFNNLMFVMSFGWIHEDVHMLVIPLFHCTACYSAVPTSVYLGSTIVLAPRPQVNEVAELVQAHGVTTFLGVPTLFHLFTTMRRFDEYDLSSLRMICYSGSPMPRQTIERLRAKFPSIHLHNFFGLTETISNTHVLPSADAMERAASVGKVLPGVGMKIMGEDGAELAPGEIGELCLRRENVIREYWRKPGLLDQSITEDGWFRTGDLAYVDEQGYVYLRGRSKDMIIVAGENVFAMEVEGVLHAHPKVVEAAVIGVEATGARSYMGEVVKAFVVTEPGVELSESDIKRHCSQTLATYKVPQMVRFVEALPRNPSGKVVKRALYDLE
jgi:acyl-CoA synthetase (AMP-forming)/AMP-acid ligase II